jgi:putative FmdB family regulatory protein
MPFYDYLCTECSEVTEFKHGMTETPELQCPFCTCKSLEKLISQVNANICSGMTHQARRIIDKSKAQTEKRVDLKENYGIHEVTPTMPNMGFDGVYKEIKRTGTLAKDQMQKTVSDNNQKTKNKEKERKEKLEKTIDKRVRSVIERKKKNAYDERKINDIGTIGNNFL